MDTTTVVGLGNPGKNYEATRHNLGFQVIDRLAEQFRVERWEQKFDALLAAGRVAERRFFLVKPQTFMNNSGRAVQALLHFYKIPVENLLVVADDLDLEVGKIRQREQGRDGGHRGLRSIAECLGTEAFKRVRIGVGRPAAGESAVGRVLRKSETPAETEKLDQAVAYAADRIAGYLRGEKFEHWSSS